MVPTAQLDRVVGRVVAGGGKVVLVGDPEQLAAPGAGGAMGLIVAEVGAAQLEQVVRHEDHGHLRAQLGANGLPADAALHLRERHRPAALPAYQLAVEHRRAAYDRLPAVLAHTEIAVDETLSSDDAMADDDLGAYFAVGESALKAIRLALLVARAPTPAHVLDFACGHGRVTRDVVFSSPSTAGAVVLGRSCNGRREWIAGSETFGAWESRGVE